MRMFLKTFSSLVSNLRLIHNQMFNSNGIFPEEKVSTENLIQIL